MIAMYFVYRFLDNENNILYVGKTKNSLNNRIRQHFSENGHLDKKCYEKVSFIEYIELKNKIEMDIKELYYINKWKPIFNSKDKNDEDFDFTIEENSKWKAYQHVDKNYEQIIDNKNKIIVEIEELLVSYERKVDSLNAKLNHLECENEVLRNKQGHNIKISTVPITVTDDSYKNRAFTKDEMLNIYSLDETPVFKSSIMINKNLKHDFVFYSLDKKIYVKDLITNKTITYKDRDVTKDLDLKIIIDYCDSFIIQNTDYEKYKEMLSACIA